MQFNSFFRRRIMILTYIISLCFCIYYQFATAELLEHVSFEKPFDQVSAEGVREISDEWEIGGSTVVNRHFIRLTPDRSNRIGHIWGKKPLGSKEFSIVLTFRVSGQAQEAFGEGLALWITTFKNFVGGWNHGFTGMFTGIGFIFDTFVNENYAGGHKDITYLENNGTRTLDDLNYMQKRGCDVPNLRYYEKNAAFTPSLNMTRVKIQFKMNYVGIAVDAGNTGDWTFCYGSNVDLPENWADDIHIGLSATTGALTDNHDVISLKVYNDVVDLNVGEMDQKVKTSVDELMNESVLGGRDLAAKVKHLKRKYEKMMEEFEHDYTALQASTEQMIEALQEQETRDAAAVAGLETWIKKKASERMSKHTAEVEQHVQEKLQQRVNDHTQKSGGWKVPFFLLVIVLLAVGGFMYKKYQELRKSHLL